jgi:DNA-binding transcriptional LysR family regulator
MDRIDAMRLFTRVVERRSFTAAAQDLELPRSTATEVLKQLENRLGVRLLQRTTRHVAPTLDGEAYYRRCLAILSDIEESESAFTGAKPTGLLRVDVQGTLARHFLLPGLPKFLEQYPGIQLHLGDGDRLVDLIREGVDCVLRVGDLRDSAMVGRRIAMLDEGTFASPTYLERFGTPERPEDLERHRMIGFVSSATGQVIPLELTVNGELKHYTPPLAMSVVSGESMAAAARAGLGLIQVPSYHLERDVAAGILVEVLSEFRPSQTPVSLLYPHSRQLSPRVRGFIDWVTHEFRNARSGVSVPQS